MYPIVRKEELNETTTLMEVEAPLVARKARPGQFIIFRIDEEGERVPLTIAGYDREKGTVTIIFQRVGYTTEKLNTLNAGDALLDFVGPLGVATHTDGIKKVEDYAGVLPDSNDQSSLGLLITQLKDRMTDFKKMMDDYQTQLYKKYDALETMIASLNNQYNTLFGGQQ